jgi:hypothetical protein
MSFISSQDVGGKDDFGYPSLKRVRLLALKNGAIRSERVDMLWRWEVY